MEQIENDSRYAQLPRFAMRLFSIQMRYIEHFAVCHVKSKIAL